MTEPTNKGSRRVRKITVTIAASLAIVVAGCSASGTVADSDEGVPASITIGFTAEDSSLDPNASIVTAWQSLLSNMYDTLIRRDSSGEIVPSLATEWAQTDDLTWQITVRDDVTFHDGTEFTASDVEYTLNRVLDADTGSPQRTYIAPIQTVNAIDDTTLEITTESPFPLLMENLQLVPIVSEEFVEEVGAERLSTEANGTGPYQLVSWEPGGEVRMESAEENWRGVPNIDEVVFRPIPEVGARVSALQAGEIDIAVGLLPESVELIEQTDGLYVQSVQSQRSNYLVIDNTVEPFDDVRVRQALNYAIDTEAIIDNLLLGEGEALPSMVGPMYRGWNDELEPYPYDPDRARELLAEAGYSDGFSFEFNSSDVRPKDREIAQAITSYLRDVGLDVENVVTEWGAFLDRYSQHDLSPLYVISFGTPVWDFGVPFNSYLLPDPPQAYFTDPEIVEAVEEVSTVSGDEERQAALSGLNQRLHEEAAFVYLFSYQDIYGVADRVEWTATSDEKIWVYDASVEG